MKKAIHYYQPVLDSTQSTFNFDRFKESVETYREGKHVEALQILIDSLNPKFRENYGNDDGTEYHIPHGSIVVDIKIEGNLLRIHSDFMELPEKGSVAMLRQVCNLNTGTLLLPSFKLRGNTLTIDYQCELNQSHPAKIYGVFSDICSTGDQYDDEFASKFGAKRIYEPRITSYSAEQVDYLYDAIQHICQEALELVADYNSKRKQGYSWNIIELAFYQIMYIASPQGQILNEMDKAIVDMDKDIALNELVNKGTEVLKKIQATPKEELAKDLYFVDQFVSTKRRSSLKNVQENFEEDYEKAEQAIQSGNYEPAVIRMLVKCYAMYYYNDVQDDINNVVAKALKESSDKELEEAANILYDAMDDIMEGNLEDYSFNGDYSQLIAQAAESITPEMQKQVEDLQASILQLQQKMMEAMSKGDMQEYMRIAAEIQQKAMLQAMNQK
ncbi:hypothetical protein [uncultured Bacteroides sp.]|uniref:hypothetical protein n=1 Tax=uncultured Bacteroides sp. TaxID=162156 RepID=UPI00262B0F79|nr:hypothetical protein [uncultured Bacteroides sp.]